MYDVFLSHASEDKDEIARPLAKALKERGLEVFFDEDVIKHTDNLRRRIDEGLSKSKNGVFILSPNFFKKEWPQKELDVFFAREILGEKVIIPVWHNLSTADILRLAPTMVPTKAIITSEKSIDDVALQIVEIVRIRRGDPELGNITEKIIRIEADRDSILLGSSISFEGSCINCKENIHLTLYGPEQYASGKEIATIMPTEKNSWSFTLSAEYLIISGNYSMVASDSQKTIHDEVTFTVEKGAVTMVIYGDQYYYIGDKIRISGTSTAGKEIYLTIKGINPDTPNRKLDQLDLLSETGNVKTFVKVPVSSDHEWSFEWDTSKVGTQLNRGKYKVYASESPVIPEEISGEAFKAVSIIIQMPFVSATASQSVILKGKNAFIAGTAEGNPGKIQIWIFGDSSALVQKIPVNLNSSFKFELSNVLTNTLTAGQYFVVIQHPMMNHFFDIDIDDLGENVYWYHPTGKKFLFSIKGKNRISGSLAAESLADALNNQNIDDTYTKLQFLLEDPKSDTSESVYRNASKEPAEMIVHVDNSIRYETDKQDLWLFEIITPFLMNKMEKIKVLISGIVCIALGFFLMVLQAYKIGIPYLMWVGLAFLLVGVIFIAAVRYHSINQCQKCMKEFAYVETGTPLVTEVTTRDGYIQQTTTRKYQCKYCGHTITRKFNKTIDTKRDSD